MPAEALTALLQSSLQIYVLRDAAKQAPGFCEFDRSQFPETELKNFGLVPAAQVRGLGTLLTLICQYAGLRPQIRKITLCEKRHDAARAIAAAGSLLHQELRCW